MKKDLTMNRSKNIEHLQHQTFDVLVIGGGITGAGIALDAQSRGLKTALVEKNDFAFGSSSRSTKLIHGGLRYLKQADIRLVRETAKERGVLRELAPHLVHPEKMLVPLVKGGTYGYVMLLLGLSIYDWLASVKDSDKKTMLSKKQVIKKEPLLKTEHLKGAGYYSEYRTDDARLTISVIKTAHNLGVVVSNYCKVYKFLYKGGKIVGATCEDILSGKTFSITAKKIVNATGPWTDILRKEDRSLIGKRLQLSKGIHIVLSKKKLPIKQNVYFEGKDGRMIFCISRSDSIYIGTTDTYYSGDIDYPLASHQEVTYLLDSVNDAFKTSPLSLNDVNSSWAGIRPLIYEEGKSPSELSRKDEIFISKSGLISIAGGKLTGYRKMAQRVVDLLVNGLCSIFVSSKTDLIVLDGGQSLIKKNVQDYIRDLYKKHFIYFSSEESVARLVYSYGDQIENIIKKIQTEVVKTHGHEIAVYMAELNYGIEFEMVQSLRDFFDRRNSAVYFDIDRVTSLKNLLACQAGFLLGWSESRRKKELNEVCKSLENAEAFRCKKN